MSDAGAGALLLLGLLLFTAAYSWLRSQRDRPDEGWLPREIANGELAFAERRFESKRLGLVARLDRAYRQGGELHLVELGRSAWTCSTRTRSWRCAEGCSS